MPAGASPRQVRPRQEPDDPRPPTEERHRRAPFRPLEPDDHELGAAIGMRAVGHGCHPGNDVRPPPLASSSRLIQGRQGYGIAESRAVPCISASEHRGKAKPVAVLHQGTLRGMGNANHVAETHASNTPSPRGYGN
jgi:hypothetical protein